MLYCSDDKCRYGVFQRAAYYICMVCAKISFYFLLQADTSDWCNSHVHFRRNVHTKSQDVDYLLHGDTDGWCNSHVHFTRIAYAKSQDNDYLLQADTTDWCHSHVHFRRNVHAKSQNVDYLLQADTADRCHSHAHFRRNVHAKSQDVFQQLIFTWQQTPLPGDLLKLLLLLSL